MAERDPDLDDDAADEELADEDEPLEVGDGAIEDSPPLVTSNAALTFREARSLTGRRGGRLVLLMGEVGAGKTTLMVETWTHLIARGPLGGHRFAGSRTAMAFEERAFLSRLAAGTDGADTRRTAEEDDGLLHLRLARSDGERFEVLFADFAGEHYERIRDGVPLLDELPWAQRADRIGVLLDGSAIGRGGARELAFNNAARQLLAVREAGGIAPTARITVLLVKDDLHDEASLETAATRVDHLLDLARSLDPEAAMIRIAARPTDASPPTGLDHFTGWIVGPDRRSDPLAVDLPRPQRAVARIRP